jgi:hypothetical protein
MHQHLLTPTAAKGLRARKKVRALAQTVIAGSARSTKRLRACGNTIGTALQNYAIANVKALYAVSYFDDLAYDLVTRVGVSMTGKRSGRDTKVAVNVDHMQVATTYACKVIAHAHPI